MILVWFWFINSFDGFADPRRLALDRERIVGRPVHQRRIVMAEQNLAEADRRLDLLLPERAHALFAFAERSHQGFGGLLDVMLQIRIGTQCDFVDGKFAGVGPAHRDEIDQCSGFVDLTSYLIDGDPTNGTTGVLGADSIGNAEGFAPGRVIRLGIRATF